MSYAWSVLSLNVVHFVLKRGPFCLKTWSVLSLTWSVLSWRGPFCPWSVLSMVRYVPNSVYIPCKSRRKENDCAKKEAN